MDGGSPFDEGVGFPPRNRDRLSLATVCVCVCVCVCEFGIGTSSPSVVTPISLSHCLGPLLLPSSPAISHYEYYMHSHHYHISSFPLLAQCFPSAIRIAQYAVTSPAVICTTDIWLDSEDSSSIHPSTFGVGAF